MTMQDLIKKHITNGFAEFEGLTVTGSVPIKQEVINELIAGILQGDTPSPAVAEAVSSTVAPTTVDSTVPQPPVEAQEIPPQSEATAQSLPDAGPTTGPAAASKPSLSPRDLLKFVRKAEVKADDGKLTLEFEIRI